MKVVISVFVAMALAISLVGEAYAAATVYNGIFNLRITVTISSQLPASANIQCTFNTLTSGQLDSISESDTVTASVNGSTAVCQLSIPYRWTLYSPGDSVALSYSVFALDTAGNGRSHYNNAAGTVQVPANGATTSYNASVTI